MVLHPLEFLASPQHLQTFPQKMLSMNLPRPHLSFRILAISTALLMAQEYRGTIGGFVTDSTGGPVT
jgi:hypothetical protein